MVRTSPARRLPGRLTSAFPGHDGNRSVGVVEDLVRDRPDPRARVTAPARAAVPPEYHQDGAGGVAARTRPGWPRMTSGRARTPGYLSRHWSRAVVMVPAASAEICSGLAGSGAACPAGAFRSSAGSHPTSSDVAPRRPLRRPRRPLGRRARERRSRPHCAAGPATGLAELDAATDRAGRGEPLRRGPPDKRPPAGTQAGGRTAERRAAGRGPSNGAEAGGEERQRDRRRVDRP